MRIRRINVPGLLSLLLLFPLLTYKLSHSQIFEKQRVLEVTWYSPKVKAPYVQTTPPRLKEYIDIDFTGNAFSDKVKIEYAKVLLDEMIAAFDTTRGVHFTFADTAKYESFIDVLDYCSQQKALTYAINESDFWIFNRLKNEEQKKTMWLGSCIVMSPIKSEAKNNLAWSFAYAVDQRFWPIGLLFTLLFLLNFNRTLGG